MNNKGLQSKKTDLQLSPNDDADIKSRRKMESLPSGVFLIEDVLEIKGSGALTFVMCDMWLIQLFELETGELSFMNGADHIRPDSKRFGIFYPPFAIVRTCFKDARGCWTGLVANKALPEKFMTVPMMFETDFTESLQSVKQVEEILNSCRNRQSIEINSKLSLLSVKAKRLIGENYLAHPSIARIAAQLGVTHEHLSRRFKHDFGLSPSAYCHQVRIAAATFRLAKGEKIADVSEDVGYNELSRFYKQFRKATKSTPGYCQAPEKRNRA